MKLERYIVLAFLLWLALAALTTLVRGAEKRLPVPEQRADTYGCTIDTVRATPGVMPGILTHVWAEGAALAKRWIRLLSMREPGQRRKSLDDCDQWIKRMEQEAKRQSDAH